MPCKRYSLLDLCSKIVDNRGKTCPVGDVGRPLIATNCVKSTLLYPCYETVRFVSEETYKSWFRAHPQAGDLIFVVKGSPGEVCLAPDPVDFCIAQDMVALRANPRLVYPRYLFALLRSADVKTRIANMHVGSLIPHFKKGDFDKLFLDIPETAEQRFIGDLYFELSELVHTLSKTSETYEAVARRIFKSWLVDFDPVRAKAQSESVEAYVSGLFPSEFQNSEIGQIPKGWAVVGLNEIATFLNGLALQKYPANSDSGSLPAIKIAQLRRGSVEGADRVASTLPPQYIVNDGDLLFSWSGSLEVEIWAGGTGALNQHLFKVTPVEVPQWFVYFWLKTHLKGFREIAAGKVTTMGHIQRHHLSEAKVLLPKRDALEGMSGVLSPLVERVITSRLKANTVIQLRESLLPRLISGKLRVPDAEKLVEAVL
jgi:type I restriction enzyme, S subunit